MKKKLNKKCGIIGQERVSFLIQGKKHLWLVQQELHNMTDSEQ